MTMDVIKMLLNQSNIGRSDEFDISTNQVIIFVKSDYKLTLARLQVNGSVYGRLNLK